MELDEERLNVIEAYEALKDKNVLFSNYKYFKLDSNKKVIVIDKNVKYSLSYNDFIELFKKETFIIYKEEQENVVDNQRDVEYYGWKHK